MKRTNIRLLILGLVATCLLVSCKKNEEGNDNTLDGQGFSAMTERGIGIGGGKTHLDGTNQVDVLWNTSDLIKVRNNAGVVLTYGLANGENTMIGTFYTGEAHDNFFQPNYTSVYPAAVGNSVTGDGTAQFTLPATQTYAEKSFGSDAMPMMAVSGNEVLPFKNVLGGICFPIVGYGQTVTSVVLTSASATDHLSGVFTSTYNNGAPTLTYSSGGSNSITLDCSAGGGVPLNSTTATDFYIMVPPGTLANGFTLKLYNGPEESDKIYEKSTNTSITISRNEILYLGGYGSGNVIEIPPEKAFSVKDNGHGFHSYIRFAHGNLQYIGSAATPYWKFADNQWDYLSTNGSSATNVDRDLFGWGTSGYHDSSDEYNTNYYPYSMSTSTVNSDYNYFGYGPSTNMTDPNLVGTSANYDWGVYNTISNGGTSSWRTLTRAEWNYLRYSRTNAGNLFGEGSVSGVNGCIFLPDDWTLPDGLTFTVGQSAWSNSYTVAEWAQMESAGAVFLPAAGARIWGTSLFNAGSEGRYWSSTYYNSYFAYYLFFSSGSVYPKFDYFGRYGGYSVRLVCPAE